MSRSALAVAPAASTGLTQEELEILQLIANGKDNIEIAMLKGYGKPILVQRRVQKILEITSSASRSAAIAWAMRRGLIE